MATLKEERAALMAKSDEYAVKAGNMTAEEAKESEEIVGRIRDLSAKIKAAEEAAEIMETFRKEHSVPEVSGAKSLGEAFSKHISEVGGKSAVFSGGVEYAAKDGEIVRDPAKLADYNLDTLGSVMPYIPEARVTSLFTNAVTERDGVEFLRWTFTGDPAAIADGALKPQLTGDYTRETANLTEIGAHIIVSEAMLEDETALEAKINDQLTRRLAIVEQAELLTGNGTSPHLAGVLNASGVGTENATAATLADVILKAAADIEDTTGFKADAVVLNPADWYTLRISKDDNGQYLLGGPAFGPYGNGSVDIDPALWQLRVVTSSAVPAGTALVGAFRDGATIYRKGGVRLRATDSHADTFTHDLVTIRIFERVGLVVEYPQAFTKITIGE